MHKHKTIYTLQSYIALLRDIVGYQKICGVSSYTVFKKDPQATLEEKINNCKRCGRHQNRKDIIYGKGNTKAKIFFVESSFLPDQSLFFENESSSLFKKILSAIDYTFDDIYFSCLIKCNCHDEKALTSEEILACRNIFSRQVNSIKPKIICTLGSVAAQTLLGTKKSVEELWGKKFSYNNTTLITSYHPQSLLLDPLKKKYVWEDIKKIKLLVKKSTVS